MREKQGRKNTEEESEEPGVANTRELQGEKFERTRNSLRGVPKKKNKVRDKKKKQKKKKELQKGSKKKKKKKQRRTL